jgi:DNA repair photolyase
MSTGKIETRVHEQPMKSGITKSPEFERKGLAEFAFNCGIKACDHDCRYCSVGSTNRMNQVFQKCGESPFGFGYAIIDPNTSDRIASDARRIRERGMIQMCTLSDAWSPVAQRYQLGRRCLEAILSQPGWTVRILTKNAAVANDFDLIAQHRDRVLVGLSLTGTPDKIDTIQAVEPNASPIADRIAALREAHRLGLRTYGMLCPLLPGIADSPPDVRQLVRTVIDCGAEEIFAEPVNARGPSLRLTQEALAAHGHAAQARAIERIRTRAAWSCYAVDLLRTIQATMRDLADIGRLRFLLYPPNLLAEHAAMIRADDAGVIWLGKDKQAKLGRSG